MFKKWDLIFILIPPLTLLFYLLLNWSYVIKKLIIFIILIAGTLLWLSGTGTNNLYLTITGFIIFISGILADSIIRFKEEIADKDTE